MSALASPDTFIWSRLIDAVLSAADSDYIAKVEEAADVSGLPWGTIVVDGAHIYEATEEARRTNRARAYRWLEIADKLVTHPALASYAHLPAVRGDLLAKLGRLEEAREEFGRAAALTGNERERALFRARADACVTAE